MKTSRMIKATVHPATCSCGSERAYQDCCARFHHSTIADSAEQLMRARYSAYVLHNDSFITATWHPSTCPEPGTLAEDRQTSWLGLEIRGHQSAGETATVEFVARYKRAGRAYRLHEISRFVREDGRWWYLGGSFPGAEKQ